MLVAPELDAALQARVSQSKVEGQNPLSQHAALDAAHDTIGFLGYKKTLLDCIVIISGSRNFGLSHHTQL